MGFKRRRFVEAMMALALTVAALLGAMELRDFLTSRQVVDPHTRTDFDTLNTISIDTPLQDKNRSALHTRHHEVKTNDSRITKLQGACADIDPPLNSDWSFRRARFRYSNQTQLAYCISDPEMDPVIEAIFQVFEVRNGSVKAIKRALQNVTFGNPSEDIYAHVFPASNQLIKRTKTVLFVRNPYERLFLEYHSLGYLPFSGCEALTFQEFLDRVISGFKLRTSMGTRFMPPIYSLCNPCSRRVVLIMKKETLAKDLDTLLKKGRMASDHRRILGVHFSRPDVIRLLRSHTRGLLHGAGVRKCNRLSHSSPFEMRINLTKHEMNIHQEVTSENTMSDQGFNILTDSANGMAEAYSNIKEETITYIQELYKRDFSIFGYSLQRPWGP